MDFKEIINKLTSYIPKDKAMPFIQANKGHAKKIIFIFVILGVIGFTGLYIVSYLHQIEQLELNSERRRQLEEERIKQEEKELEQFKETLAKENIFYKNLMPYEIGGLYGYVNDKYEIVVEPIYSDANKFSEELAVVKLGNKYGYLDKRGKIYINPEYDYAWDFKNGYAFVGKENKYTFIDQRNMAITGYNFDKGEKESIFNDGLANVCIGGKYGFINNKGEFIIEPKYNFAGSFNSSYALVSKNKIYFYINRQGEQVGNIAAENATDFSEGRALIQQNGFVYVIDSDFRKIKTNIKKAQGLGEFSNGFAVVKTTKNSCSYLDTNGALVKGKKFESAGKFSEGLAPVKIGGKWGYINTDFNVVIPPKYNGVGNFENGYARVYIDASMYYIDKKGNIFWQP